jgi:hypothetical protein
MSIAGIRIESGINIGGGINVGASGAPPGPPVPTNNYWSFDPSYLGPNLAIGQAGAWNSLPVGDPNMEIYATYPETSIGLGVLTGGVSLQTYSSKIMFTVYVATEDTGDIPLDLAGIGVAYRSVNLSNPLGTDNQSWGYRQNGTVLFYNNIITTGLPTYGPLDYIDIACDFTVGLAWVRVNGGAWNGGGADPAMQLNGIYIPTSSPLYPAGGPGAYNYIDAMDVSKYTYNIPSGYTAI